MRDEEKRALEAAMEPMTIGERDVFVSELKALDGSEFRSRLELAMRAVELHRSALKRPWDSLPEDKARVFRAICAEARRLYGVGTKQLTSKGHEATQARRWIRTAMSIVFGTIEASRILGTDKCMISQGKRQLLAEAPDEFASANAFGEQLKGALTRAA